MIDFIGSAFPLESAALLAGLDVVFKATLLLALAYAIHAGLGRGRALARSALWNATLIGLLLVPLASLALPRLHIALLPAMEAAPAIIASVADGPAVQPENSVLAQEPVRTAPVGIERATRPPSAYTKAVSAAEPASATRIGIAGLVAAIYVAVAGFLAIRLVASLVKVRGLWRRCEPVDEPAWLRSLERTRETLNISAPVALVKSDLVSIPMVVGWIPPVIVLPDNMAQTAGAALVDMVLLHELAHVRRGDFAWNLVHKLVRLMYWPHPLIWPVGRLINSVREQACDDLCVHETGSAGAYRDSLLEVASGLVRRPELSVGLALARESNLARRLAWIDASQGKSRCLMSLPGRFGMALAIMVVAGVVGAIELERQALSAPQGKDGDAPHAARRITQPPAIEIAVMAKDTGKRLPGATVRFSIDFKQVICKADRDGVVRFDLTKRVFEDVLTFDVWGEGYVQQRHFFAGNDVRYPKIPSQLSVELLPGEETLGGKVTDEQGRPIAGVKVDVWGYLGGKKEKHELAYMVDATTDERGQWRCRCFRGMTFVYLFLSHPDYLSDGEFHPREHGKPRRDMPAPASDQPLAGLRDLTDLQVMTAGVSLSGKVTDERDKPIAGAEVGWFEEGDRNPAHESMPVTTTDARGYFRFPHVRPGKLVIQVKAKGHAPALKPLDAIDMAGHLTVKLGPPRSLRGRVVDSGGKPVPDVLVNIDTWRGYRFSLGLFLKTNADGRFQWDEAPPDSVLISASRSGFAAITKRGVSPEEKEITLILKRSLSISGRITDAITEKPIDQADVEVGVADAETGKIVWARDSQVFAFQGTLQGNIDVEKTPELRLRINAAGYEPVVSRVFRRDENGVEYDVKLRKAETP